MSDKKCMVLIKAHDSLPPNVITGSKLSFSVPALRGVLYVISVVGRDLFKISLEKARIKEMCVII